MTTSIDRLAAAFKDVDPRVPAIAFLLIGQRGDFTVPAADELSKMLEHEDPMIRLNPEQAVKLQDQLQAVLGALRRLN